jgi:hypothetical protein
MSREYSPQKENEELEKLAYCYGSGGGNLRDDNLGENPFEKEHKRWRKDEDLTEKEKSEMTQGEIERWIESKRIYREWRKKQGW